MLLLSLQKIMVKACFLMIGFHTLNEQVHILREICKLIQLFGLLIQLLMVNTRADIYDRLDAATALHQDLLQSNSVDGSSRQADYLAARSTPVRSGQELFSYGGRYDTDLHALSLHGICFGKSLHGTSLESEYLGGILARAGYSRLDDRKDDVAYARELERRMEDRRREILREPERERDDVEIFLIVHLYFCKRTANQLWLLIRVMLRLKLEMTEITPRNASSILSTHISPIQSLKVLNSRILYRGNTLFTKSDRFGRRRRASGSVTSSKGESQERKVQDKCCKDEFQDEHISIGRE
ncbi:putative Cell cycle and apoptosis regulator protein [Helianthus debilis subsp. tardiflorus]